MGEILVLPYSENFTAQNALVAGFKWVSYYYLDTGTNFEIYMLADRPNVKLAIYYYIPNSYRYILASSEYYEVWVSEKNLGTGLVYNSYHQIPEYNENSGVYIVEDGMTHDARNTAAGLAVYQSYEEALTAITGSILYPITYRLTNCTAPNAPTEAAAGSNVVVPLVFPDGYGITNNSDIYVTNNGVVIPSQYSNGTLTFTMP